MIRSQSAWANSSRDPVLKKTHHKKGGGVAQGEGSEFKPQHCKKKKKKKKWHQQAKITEMHAARRQFVGLFA
jgi:hypothetical protein